MKRNSLFVTLALLLFAASSFGQPAKQAAKPSVKQQLAALKEEAAPFLGVREANKKTLETLNQTKSDIDFGSEALNKGAAKYKESKASYDIDLGAYTPAAAELNTALDAHNANRCQKTTSNDCAAYEAEADRLNSRRAYLQTVKDSLDNRKTILDGTLKELRELQSTMQAKFEKYTADAKAYNAQNEENEAKIKALAERWNAITNSLGDCYKKLPDNATDEQVHEACGAAWDGNAVGKAPVKNQGTGGATPNK